MAELDPVIHTQARLRVCATLAALARDERISFSRLQDLLEMTPGNLITHLRKLADVGYVDMGRAGGRNAATTVALTDRGRVAFDDYRAALRALLADLPDTLTTS